MIQPNHRTLADERTWPMPPLQEQGRLARRIAATLAACALLLGCTGSPTTSGSPQPTPTPETDEASDSVLTGTVMPQIKF
ncbi:hypothetical protein D3C86_1920880 [compost metagenome]